MEEGEVEGWIRAPLDPPPRLPDFSLRTSSSRLSLLPRPPLISVLRWLLMVYTRAGCRGHSTHFCWSSSAEKLRSSESRDGLFEMVMEGGGARGVFTRRESELLLVLEQGCR